MTPHQIPDCNPDAPASFAAPSGSAGQRKVHVLKLWPQFVDPIAYGRKRFEIRRADRDFRVGDILHLREWFPERGEWGPRNITCFVTYILHGPAFGIEEGFCAMSIEMPANHQWPPNSINMSNPVAPESPNSA